jgi:hypothetical protein
MGDRIQTFEDFWPYYLQEHSNTTCRALHYIGTTISLCLLVTAIVTGNYWIILGAFFCGYFFAWVGHFGFEKNRPATFQYPRWSLRSDFKMYFLAITFQLQPHLDAALRPSH